MRSPNNGQVGPAIHSDDERREISSCVAGTCTSGTKVCPCLHLQCLFLGTFVHVFAWACVKVGESC